MCLELLRDLSVHSNEELDNALLCILFAIFFSQINSKLESQAF